jgi:hypothetical protein
MLLMVPGWLLFFAVRLAITNSAATVTATAMRWLGAKRFKLMSGSFLLVGAVRCEQGRLIRLLPPYRLVGPRFPAVGRVVVVHRIDLLWTLG